MLFPVAMAPQARSTNEPQPSQCLEGNCHSSLLDNHHPSPQTISSGLRGGTLPSGLTSQRHEALQRHCADTAARRHHTMRVAAGRSSFQRAHSTKFLTRNHKPGFFWDPRVSWSCAADDLPSQFRTGLLLGPPLCYHRQQPGGAIWGISVNWFSGSPPSANQK